jgi:hypothetical protein
MEWNGMERALKKETMEENMEEEGGMMNFLCGRVIF